MAFERLRRMLLPRRRALSAVALALLAVALLDVLIDPYLRRVIERKMNQRLAGYSVTLAAVDFSPWNLSLDLLDLILVQQAHPEPPVAAFPRINFNVQWTSLLRGRVVADAFLEGPRLRVNLDQLREERDDEVEIDERGWQAALLAAYPLKINELEIVGGALTYRHRDPDRPLELTDLRLLAENVRNVRSPERTYPSSFRLESGVFGSGRAVVEGRADFLAEPYAGARAEFLLDEVPLGRLDPVSRDVRLVVDGGLLSARGEMEYAPSHREVHVAQARVRGVRIDYVFDPELTRRAVEAVQRAEDDPRVLYRLDLLHLDDSELGFVNRITDPGYRVFLSGAAVRLRNLGNGREEPVSELRAEGKFMGSGEAAVAAAFRSDGEGADFDLKVAIRGTRLAAMNDLLRAYAKADVTEGVFSFYSELSAADGRLEGYVKPHFQDVEVYDSEQDRHDRFFRRIYEGIVEGLAELLENRSREEVATIADLRGSLDDPGASNLQVILNLIRNAFFESILPGFRGKAG